MLLLALNLKVENKTRFDYLKSRLKGKLSKILIKIWLSKRNAEVSNDLYSKDKFTKGVGTKCESSINDLKSIVPQLAWKMEKLEKEMGSARVPKWAY